MKWSFSDKEDKCFPFQLKANLGHCLDYFSLFLQCDSDHFKVILIYVMPIKIKSRITASKQSRCPGPDTPVRTGMIHSSSQNGSGLKNLS